MTEIITRAVKNIFTVNLGVKKHERILVFTDLVSKNEITNPEEKSRRDNLRDIARLAVETGSSLCREIIFFEYPASRGHGMEPPQKIWQLAFGEKAADTLNEAGLLRPLLKKKASDKQLIDVKKIINKYKRNTVHAVIALSNYSTSHTRFRNLLTDICSTRYASMPLFDISMFEGPMAVDWKALANRTKKVAGVINKAEHIEIRTPNGTHISFSKKGRKAVADTGLITSPGSFSNLPAGEAFLAPVEGTAQGMLVLEWASTRKLDSPITIIVNKGMVTDISGLDEYTDYLQTKLSSCKENANIAELGIGTNNMASRPDNILESEKIMGTIHIALGDNSSFGGKVSAPFHQDFVFFRPTITLIDKTCGKYIFMKKGKFLGGIA